MKDKEQLEAIRVILRGMSDSNLISLASVIIALEAQRSEDATPCVWRYDWSDDTWEGDCGVMWQLTDGTPSENGMCYCPQCGRVLMEAGGEEEE